MRAKHPYSARVAIDQSDAPESLYSAGCMIIFFLRGILKQLKSRKLGHFYVVGETYSKFRLEFVS